MTPLTDSMALTAEDEEDLRRRGISHTTLSQQLATFQKGIPFTHILRPCTINDGVTVISSADQASLVGTCDAARLEGRITKFVPASGAATRMFKSLLAACPPTGSVEQTTPPSEADRRVVQQFLDQLEQFAFYEDLEGLIHQEGQELNGLHPQHHQDRILRAVLHHPGLNYSRLPKGLLKFHKYSNDSRTPILEHLVEGTIYAKDERNRVRIHFTISPEHRTAIYQHLEEASQRLGSLDCQWDITCSEQLPSTDTLAVDPQNQPFRDREGKTPVSPWRTWSPSDQPERAPGRHCLREKHRQCLARHQNSRIEHLQEIVGWRIAPRPTVHVSGPPAIGRSPTCPTPHSRDCRLGRTRTKDDSATRVEDLVHLTTHSMVVLLPQPTDSCLRYGPKHRRSRRRTFLGPAKGWLRLPSNRRIVSDQCRRPRTTGNIPIIHAF